MTLTGCDYKSMELDCLLLQIFWETLSECCFGAKADGMAAIPFLVPTEGRFKLGILASILAGFFWGFFFKYQLSSSRSAHYPNTLHSATFEVNKYKKGKKFDLI